jgi:hypothetical protein
MPGRFSVRQFLHRSGQTAWRKVRTKHLQADVDVPEDLWDGCHVYTQYHEMRGKRVQADQSLALNTRSAD